jgi:hypothetical protein
MNLRQMFCFHDWAKFRRAYRTELKPSVVLCKTGATSDAVAYHTWYLEDECHLMFMAPSDKKDYCRRLGDYYCIKCWKFDFRLKKWLKEQDKIVGKRLDRIEKLNEGVEKARAVIRSKVR